MRRAIVTGATGAVGTALIRNLIKNQVEVLVLCRSGSKRLNAIPKHSLVRVADCSLDRLSELENDTGNSYDVFYHFAWEGTFGAERNDVDMQNRNVRYTLDAVRAAKRFGCHTFIGAGSQAEYGRVEGVLRADTPAFPENGYGIGKLCAGQMSRILCHQLGMRHIWTRILSVYGPNDGQNTMVMSTINKLKNGEIPKLTLGEQMWDYLYSEDAGEAFYLIGKNGVDGKTYTLGSGEAHPLKEYVKIIRDVVAPEGELNFGAVPYAENQVMYLCADISELINDTGWKPTTEFKEGIRRII